MCTWLASARAVTPMNIETAMAPSRASVVAAFLLLGGLKAGTPLLIASTPVSAVQPEANARRRTKTRASPAKFELWWIWYFALSAVIPLPNSTLYPPTASSTTMAATNR